MQQQREEEEKDKKKVCLQTWQQQELTIIDCNHKLPVTAQRMRASDNAACLTINTQLCYFAWTSERRGGARLLHGVSNITLAFLGSNCSQMGSFYSSDRVEGSRKRRRGVGNESFHWRRADSFSHERRNRSRVPGGEVETTARDKPVWLFLSGSTAGECISLALGGTWSCHSSKLRVTWLGGRRSSSFQPFSPELDAQASLIGGTRRSSPCLAPR